MATAADHERMRHDLMDGAIVAVAQRGMEGLTTRAISAQSKLNEAYIYRYFLDRDDLLRKAFLRWDARMFDTFCQYHDELKEEEGDYEIRVRHFFDKCWSFMLSDFDSCKFYLRFYSSTLFNADVLADHYRVCDRLFSRVRDRFLEGVDSEMLMQHIFSTTIGYVMSVATGLIQDSEEMRAKIFSILFKTLNQFVAKI